jgi:hypothetical protein
MYGYSFFSHCRQFEVQYHLIPFPGAWLAFNNDSSLENLALQCYHWEKSGPWLGLGRQ